MPILKSEFLQKHWPLVITAIWLLFASSTRLFGIVLAESGCYSTESGFYWLFTTYAWPALIASILTSPFAFLLIIWMGEKWPDKWSVSYKATIALLMIGIQIVACWGAILWFLGAPLHRASVRTPDHVYHVAACTSDMDVTDFQLYECDRIGLICSMTYRSACGQGTGYCMFMRLAVEDNELIIYGAEELGGEMIPLHDIDLTPTSHSD
jgi:hypothetical protein